MSNHTVLSVGFDVRQNLRNGGGTAVVALNPTTGQEVQRWAYPLLLVLSGVALGVSGLPAPLYRIYEADWHLSPLSTTIVFAVYAVAALGAVLVSGRVSDVIGRKPVLLGAIAALIVGLGVFLIADNMAMLLFARTIHGAAVGSIVVAGAAALLDLRPDHGVRSGQLSGVTFNIGMTIAIVGSALLAQYAPHPLRTPYAVVAVICLAMGAGLLALREPHTSRGAARSGSPDPLSRRRSAATSGSPPSASWRRGRYSGCCCRSIRRWPPARRTSTTWCSAGRSSEPRPSPRRWRRCWPPRCRPGEPRSSATSGMAISLILTVPVLLSHHWQLVFVAAALLGATFGLGFGGSLRHLSNVVPAGPSRRDDVGLLPAGLHRHGGADDRRRMGGHQVGPRRDVPVLRGHRRAACLGAAIVGVRSTRAARRRPRVGPHAPQARRPDIAAYAGRFDLPPASSGTPLTVTWAGVTTLLIDDGSSAVMTDGFFSRPSLLAVAARPLTSSGRVSTPRLSRLSVNRLDAVVPVHTHFDHAMDSAVVAELTGARLIGGTSATLIGRGQASSER